MESENPELRSEQVQEILGLVPNWMVRFGNTLVLFLAVGLLLISYFIKYPRTVISRVVLTTANPVEDIRAGITGDFLGVHARNLDNVRSDELLATVQNGDSMETLRSSLNGQIHFVGFWETGSNVRKGDLLFRIVPSDHECYIGKIKIPMEQADKIEKGQRVRIRLSEYLNVENDVLEATIHRISSAADDTGSITVEARINENLVTLSGTKIDFKPGLNGTSEIVIEDLRLIERFFYQLKTIFKE